MFVIVVYDVSEKRVNRVLKTCRKYLSWVQNSVLEGDLEESSIRRLRNEVKEIIRDDEDSVLFYQFRTKKYFRREIIGLDKKGDDQFI
ncbi:MAG: CRISPR-associated endonuclease Cas2 [Thermoplasmatales archaeon B_DKE]|nr:MAG: CRISPR-associated endonuclease Cas2 [Thermoplasmatales archaeon B_DKE]